MRQGFQSCSSHNTPCYDPTDHSCRRPKPELAGLRPGGQKLFSAVRFRRCSTVNRSNGTNLLILPSLARIIGSGLFLGLQAEGHNRGWSMLVVHSPSTSTARPAPRNATDGSHFAHGGTAVHPRRHSRSVLLPRRKSEVRSTVSKVSELIRPRPFGYTLNPAE